MKESDSQPQNVSGETDRENLEFLLLTLVFLQKLMQLASAYYITIFIIFNVFENIPEFILAN